MAVRFTCMLTHMSFNSICLQCCGDDFSGLDCNFESGFCGWNDSSNLIKFVYRDGKPMQFDNPFQNKTRRYFRTKSMALFKWKYRTNYFYKLGKMPLHISS